MAKSGGKKKVSKAKAAPSKPAKKPAAKPAKKTTKAKSEAPKKAPAPAKKAKATESVQKKVTKSVKQGIAAVKEKFTKTVAKAKSSPKLIGKTATLVMPAVESSDDSVVDEGFTAQELERFRAMLIEHREIILEKAKQLIASGNIEIDRTEMTDEVDLASATIEQNLQFRLLDRDRKLLSEIEHALTKINTGEFGYCEGTGEMIPKRRLELRPWTRHSVKYKEQIERMKKTGRGVFDEDGGSTDAGS